MRNQCRVSHLRFDVLCKYNEVLDIDDAISEGCGANIAQGVVFTPVVNHDTHIRNIDNPVAIEVNHWAKLIHC